MNRSEKCLMCVVLFVTVIMHGMNPKEDEQGAFVTNSKHLLTHENKTQNVTSSSGKTGLAKINIYEMLCDSLSCS